MMLKLDKRVWLYLLAYLGIIVTMGLVFSGKIDRINKIGLTQGFALIILIAMFSSQKMLIGLKPSFRVSNIKYIIPLFFILITYALVRTNDLGIYEDNIGYICFIIFIAFVQTLTEEMIFRGVIINNYLKNGLNIFKAVLYSSIIFGGLHLIAIFGRTPAESVINQAMSAVMIGVFLGAVFVLTKNIYIAGIFHMIINVPSYFNRIGRQIAESKINPTDLEVTGIWETLFSSVMLVIIYSPFLIVGLYLLSKAKKEPIKTK